MSREKQDTAVDLDMLQAVVVWAEKKLREKWEMPGWRNQIVMNTLRKVAGMSYDENNAMNDQTLKELLLRERNSEERD